MFLCRHVATNRCYPGATNGLMAEMMEIHMRDILLADEPSLKDRAQCTDDISGFIRSYLK